jgi:uncharacterized coiled-coil protein SlyX
MTNEAVAAMPPASGAGNQNRIGSTALARGLLLMRASAINVVRLQLAMERRDRKAALSTVDELMRLDRRIDEFLCRLPEPEDTIEAEREALDEQGRALAREKLALAAEMRGPRLAAVSTAWTDPPDRPEPPAAASDSTESVLELTVVAQPGRISRGTLIQVALTVLLGILAGLAAFLFLNPAGPEEKVRSAAVEGVSS